MAHSARLLGEKSWEFTALPNSQGRGAKWSLLLWLRGQLRRTLAQSSNCWQKSGPSELLACQPLAPPEPRRKGPCIPHFFLF